MREFADHFKDKWKLEGEARRELRIKLAALEPETPKFKTTLDEMLNYQRMMNKAHGMSCLDSEDVDAIVQQVAELRAKYA